MRQNQSILPIQINRRMANKGFYIAPSLEAKSRISARVARASRGTSTAATWSSPSTTSTSRPRSWSIWRTNLPAPTILWYPECLTRSPSTWDTTTSRPRSSLWSLAIRNSKNHFLTKDMSNTMVSNCCTHQPNSQTRMECCHRFGVKISKYLYKLPKNDFTRKMNWFWHLYKNCLVMWAIWAK